VEIKGRVVEFAPEDGSTAENGISREIWLSWMSLDSVCEGG
jgi:hypothetical protein